MDIEQKKGEVKADIARGPENVVFSRIDICDEIQLADLMKEQFTPYFKDTAPQDGTGDSLHNVCIKLAKQRALLQGAAHTDVINFDIGTAAQYANSAGLSLPTFQDSSYSNKTSFGFITLHDVNESGGSITLSSTSNANTTIIDDDGNAIKYFTDFSKYFLTRARANGELISIDENTAPYMVPTVSEPFIPPNTINGEIYRGTAPPPTANSDVRFEFGTVANTSGGNAGGDLDIVENQWTGNTFVTIEVTDVVGTFATSETISDYDLNTATVKTYANTTSIFLEGQDSKGTFVVGEIISDLSTNATISTAISLSDTEKNISLSGNTFITGSNTDISLGFDTSNTISLDTDAVSRTGGTVTVIANNHGINSGERIALRGADDEYSEFNDTFIVEDTTSNTFTFTTANTISATPTGDFSLVNNIVFGRTSNASMSIFKRTANSSAQIVFQSDDLSAGFPIANTITGSSSGATGMINSRTLGGTWYQSKTNEVKTFFSNSTIVTWDYDATNNPVGIPATANAGVFWLQEFEPVKISQVIAGTNAGTSTETISKMVLDIAIAVSGQAGGYDTSINTKLPGIYFAYPIKSYEDQVHDGVTTLNAYESFANVITAPEGLEINFDWLPLSQDAAGNKTGADIAGTGLVGNTAHIPDKMTTLNKANFEAHLGVYGGADTLPIDDVFISTNPDTRSSGVKEGVVYPSINTNPFYPAVLANTNSATVYSAPNGANTANDSFAGSYTEIQTGAIEPTGNWRYRIWNDIKWTYGVNPHAAGASKSGAYNAPRANTFLDVYDGYSTATTGFAANTLTPITSETAKGSQANTVNTTTLRVAAGAHTITAPTWNIVSSEVNETSATYKLADQTISSFQGLVATVEVDGTLNPEASNGVPAYSAGGLTESACYHNFIHRILTDGTASGNSMTSAKLEPKLKTLHTLLTNLTASTTAYANTGYRDPNEPSSGTQITDAVFETAVSDMKGKIDDLISAHSANMNTLKADSDGTFAPPSGTGNHAAVTVTGTVLTAASIGDTHWEPAGYNSGTPSSTESIDFSEFKDELALFIVDLRLRITEISNRIGYVNSKDVADGGSGTKSVSGTYQGFQGYAFNNGNGYANTIYSHANFLAGKKINILGKVLKAITAVQAMYDSVTTKRSEYYEYNQ